MGEEIVVLDEQKMLDKILDLPNQLERAWTSYWIKEIPVTPDAFDRVLICGMGGSGIAGQLAKELFAEAVKPINVWADYRLPGWANERTLVIAVSYSGDTEETIDAVKLAIERKCPLLLITKGGKLEQLAKINSLPIWQVEYDSLPRAAIGWLYGLLLTALARLQVINLAETSFFQALAELKSTISGKTFPDKAQDLAMTLSNKVPIVLAHSPLQSVAKRWVTQFNENSKTFAFTAPMPELCHNTIVGLDFAVPEKLTVLYLETKFGFSRNVARQKVVAEIFADKEINFTPLSVRSSSALAEQLLLIHFGDLLSFYLAGVNGIDPTPIESIVKLKEKLSKV
ncbi:MAG TPA: bifunctional phosphoglucose/phosphomannose isomerase [Candidatus Saccharimonadales bacterium]|nr:bifunctional phosphoglucose/phosphomannose isomerase [Candidatus Saccharimonadales bacterium]